MKEIKIAHISDLHLSERLFKEPNRNLKAPHRYGHDIAAFYALDQILKELEWDLLIITGDISRIGNSESFEYARNWLENELFIGEYKVGLNLSKAKGRNYVIIPGNHDSFNGGLVQSSLNNYNEEFPVIRPGTTESYSFNDIKVNIHLFDSTTEDHSFAFGEIEDKFLVPKRLQENEVDIAILHHHFLVPPKHKRSKGTDIKNTAQVAAYMINTGFNCVFFGHTHKSYIGFQSSKILGGLISDKRVVNRVWKNVKKLFLKNIVEDNGLTNYRREGAKNGQFPTMEKYFEFLYLIKNGHEVKRPSEFNSIDEFYSHLNEFIMNRGLKDELEIIQKRKVLISLAPSACQQEANWKGFHYIRIKSNDSYFDYDWDRYQYNGTLFEKKDRDEHQS